VSAVGDAVKRYMRSAEELVAGRYQHLKDVVPEYLVHPGTVLAAVCPEGIVVRYESKSEDTRKCFVMVIRQSLQQVTAMLSQNLIHIETADTPTPPIDSYGVEFKLQATNASGQVLQEFMSARVWFHAKQPSAPATPQDRGAKPYALLSVRNTLTVQIGGVICAASEPGAKEQPFLATTKIRLLAGWDCIEVFPSIEPDLWSAEFAPLWAERDILAAAVVAHSEDANLRDLDPFASARREYAAVLAKFRALLDSNPDREQALQSFLQENPVLLCPTHTRMWPKLPFGAKISDFVFREANNDYVLVEIERSTLELFRKDGHATADLTHAQGQIVDWKRYLEDNLHTVQRELGLIGITPNPTGLVVIGRSSSLSLDDRRKLQTMASESPKLRIMTYDDVYENAKALLENLLGPMWDTGGATQIHYLAAE
jgi:hypothetical protein